MTNKTPQQDIEDRTKSAYRAVSGDVEGDVSFSGGQTSLTSGATRLIRKNKKMTARLPSPVESQPLETQPHLRGAADGIALYRKYHDDALTSGINTTEGQALFNVLEQVRCEALGARQMDGVGQNLSAALESACVKKKYDDSVDIPMEDSLYALAFEQLSNQKMGRTATHTANQVRQQIETKLGVDGFKSMESVLDDQVAFTRASDLFIRTLLNMEIPSDSQGDELADNNPTEMDSLDTQESETAGEDGQSDDSDNADTTPADMQELDMSDGNDGDDNTSQMGGDDNSTDMDMDGAEDSAGQAQEMKIPTDAFDDRDINYQIYTTEFD